MRRRDFMKVIAASAASWPLASRAQQPSEHVKRIGVLMTFAESDPEGKARIAAFRRGLQQLGWTEGRNVRIEDRWATTDRELIRQYASELVALQPDLIVAQNTPATAAILQQTRTIPVIFFQASDPVGSNFVASLPRPGGNVTGFTDLEDSLASKWVELLKEIAPRVGRVAFLFNPATATYSEYYLSRFKAAALSFRVEAIEAPVHDASGLASAIAAHARAPNGGLIVMPEASMGLHRAEIVSLAARWSLPAVYPYRHFVEVGGLSSYGADLLDQYRHAATYVDRILKGEKPRDLPVQAPTKFELLINLKTAKALAIEIPASLLARADQVIE